MTFPGQPTELLSLPAELLLIILNKLYEIHHFPARRLLQDGYLTRTRPTTFRSIGGIHSISTVNRRLRSLCLSILFKITRCTSLERFREFSAACIADPEFAGLIRELDVVEIDNRDTLAELLPRLTSLVQLDLKANILDAALLAIVNAHLTLATVVVRDSRLKGLVKLLSSTELSFSKILVSTTILDRDLAFNSEELLAVVQRGARFTQFILQYGFNPQAGASSQIILPDLRHFDLATWGDNIPPGSWLPTFALRHTYLHSIDINNADSLGKHHDADLPFVRKFLAALRQAKENRVRLCSFSMLRPTSWESLTDWEVVRLELKVNHAPYVFHIGFPALKTIAKLAPRCSSLDIILHASAGMEPMHTDAFAKPFASMPALRTLHLTNGYEHLQAGGSTPWIPSRRGAARARQDVMGTSTCVAVLDAMPWYMAHVAQKSPALELVHVTDSGRDEKGRITTPWSHRASYRVRPNEARDLEIGGTPKLEMADIYLPRVI
ncbi:hypothetical protein B0H19DRAFT_495200 [Mycena capillaripes]|nr:hypothetical protein B0H19DRAFT_495200 [Mycena capillaripes]